MSEIRLNKRERNVERTRERLLDAAVELYGEHGIDAVSLREIALAAAQGNPNALQYHFVNRDGLLQAIVDLHATRIGALRENYLRRPGETAWRPGEAAARSLVMPVMEYIAANPAGVNYVKIVSQIAAVYQSQGGAAQDGPIRFPENAMLARTLRDALADLPPREAQRRSYLAVNIMFHSIADICRASEQLPAHSPFASRGPMVEQLICLLSAYFAMPAWVGQ